MVASINKLLEGDAVRSTALSHLHISLFGDYHPRGRACTLHRLLELTFTLGVVGVVLAHTLGHPKEFDPLSPIAKAPTLVYSKGDSSEDYPIVSRLTQHHQIGVFEIGDTLVVGGVKEDLLML